jgi:hypothetical protein
MFTLRRGCENPPARRLRHQKRLNLSRKDLVLVGRDPDEKCRLANHLLIYFRNE